MISTSQRVCKTNNSWLFVIIINHVLLRTDLDERTADGVVEKCVKAIQVEICAGTVDISMDY